MKELDLHEKYNISQVAATMAIENMPLDRQAHENLAQLAEGSKTVDQLIDEIKKEYTTNG